MFSIDWTLLVLLAGEIIFVLNLLISSSLGLVRYNS